MENLIEYFITIEDPRAINRRHNLIDILIIAVSAVIGGADTWEEIALYGRLKEAWFKKYLELPSGIPSHDTIARVFSLIEPEEFGKRFLSWVRTIKAIDGREVIAIDGKTANHSYDHREGKGPLHMVSAWATRNRVVLGQLKVEDKTNEITAIPELLALLDLRGSIVTIDAMGTQKSIAQEIVNRQSDYILCLKGNHEIFRDEVEEYFQWGEREGYKDIAHDYYETIEKDHGRIDKRQYWSVSDISWFQERSEWAELKSITMVKATRKVNGTTSVERRYYISSLDADASLIGSSIRAHWGIENSLHWVLDIVFREDNSRIRKDHAPENIALIRRIALNLLKSDTSLKRSMKAKRLTAGWDNDYLAKILFNS